MKFNEKYPSLKPGEVEGDILRVDHFESCHECGHLCSFIEVNTEAYFCSDECVDKFYHEFYKANMARILDESI